MKIFYITLFLLFSSITYSQSPCLGLDSINYSGQWYHTVQIGNQCWLKENLNVGKMILAVKNQINNDSIEKFCYNNDPAMCDMYGGLYQWREAMQFTKKQGTRGICPIGWHIPLISEFDTLISSVKGDAYALKKIGQGGGTNTSGFSGLLSGDNEYNYFRYLGTNANFWCSLSFHLVHADPYDANYLELWNDNAVYSGRYYNTDFGLSVRCIRDTSTILLQSPYGNENWQVGSNHNISWGGKLIDKKIKLEYSTDKGISWLNILDSTPAQNGSFNWNIPNSPSKNCKVKITDLNNPNSYCLSDSVFTIYTSCPGGSTILHGGKTYNTIMIENKCWFKENVNLGTMIPGIQTPTTNGIIEKYCYNDDTANCSIYGGLYTFPEMSEPDFCPTFWHTPSYSTFETLINNVIWDGNALKERGQGEGFGAGTNTSGFSALLAGCRNLDGTFNKLGDTIWFPYDYFIYPNKIDIVFLESSSSYIRLNDNFYTNNAGSVRCVMDDVGPLLLKTPVGGENWLIGTTQKISWTYSNVINIKLDYTTDNGASWIKIIPSTPTSAGSYNWTIPNTASKICRVRISSVNNQDTNSISNLFRIFQVGSNKCPGLPTIDYEGQTYKTIAIGNQCWLKENLNIGSMVNVTIDQSNNGIIEKHCYNNDTANCRIYGGYYQWDEAMQYSTTEGTIGICPMGWHLPTWNEFTTLSLTVGANGHDLEEIGQGFGTNASGFSALLGGASYMGAFNFFNSAAFFWCSKAAYYFELIGDDSTIFGGSINKTVGSNIRCINDLAISELPVELISFSASPFDNNIKLIWNTATESNTSSFEIEKKTLSANIWQKLASIKASGTSTTTKQYSYIDNYANSGNYSYRLKMIDLDGSFKYSNIINIEIAPPAKFELSNAYPNPWNPATTIRYQVPTNILATIKVFDALGKEIATLVNEIKPAGNYEITFNAKGLSSGTYYCRMKAGNFVATKKLILIK
jgi:uncharacterized protein (TIGR02145 family)